MTRWERLFFAVRPAHYVRCVLKCRSLANNLDATKTLAMSRLLTGMTLPQTSASALVGKCAFTEETLYDYSSQSFEPFFDYESHKEAGCATLVLAHPDQVPGGTAAKKIIADLTGNKVPSLAKPDDRLTRSDAAQLIYQHVGNGKKQ